MLRLFALVPIISMFFAAEAAATPLGVEAICDEGAVQGTPTAEGVSKPPPVYPPEAIANESEGWTRFELTVATDGSTKDIVLVDQIGPDEFVKAALDSVRTWRYLSRRHNGTPVETYGASVDVTFAFEDTGQGRREASDAFNRRYDQARAAIKAHDYPAAIRALSDALNLHIGLYEQTMGSYLLAVAEGASGGQGWHRALTHIRHATITRGQFLEPSVKPVAIDLDVLLEAQDGNYKEALCTYRRERAAGTNLSPQTVQLGEKVAGLLAGAAPLVIPAEIAADSRRGSSAPPQWRHPMLRSKFSFSAVKGNAKGFRLRCTSTILDSPVSEETQWTVPPDAGTCTLFVYGNPGTAFQLIEED